MGGIGTDNRLKVGKRNILVVFAVEILTKLASNIVIKEVALVLEIAIIKSRVLRDAVKLISFKQMPDVTTLLIDTFDQQDPTRRGILTFIENALQHLEEFGVHRDLETYKKLMDLYPKGKLIPETTIQRAFIHYPEHQNSGISILDEMEWNKVSPDNELFDLVINVFGRWSLPYLRIGAMMYWFSKFNNVTPFPIPKNLPSDIVDLTKICFKHMASVDLQTEIEVFQAEDLKDSIDHTWIVSAQSPKQRELIEKHPPSEPMYVEGPYMKWVDRTCINYFVLRANCRPLGPQLTKTMYDDITNISLAMFGGEKTAMDLIEPPSVHEQKDGIYVGICATGTSSRDSLLSWIRCLQEKNPKLAESIPVLFTLKSPPTEITVINNPKSFEYLPKGEDIENNNKVIDPS
ncbi:Evolutionarily conserved signaling intermediate in Toll pathway, mitochondrial [Nymphon striatum]|nr:Evolutionarily conserved signaling intermediate in Toll pathway, mitochondrial [Nymphon striatum]